MNSQGETRVVIILHVTYKPNQKSILFEVWEIVANPGSVTRQTPPNVPTATSSFTVDDQGVVNPPGAKLQIPYTSVFDNAPPPGAVDLVITSVDLGVMVVAIFRGLQ